jgi:hypothetical protein
MAVGEVSEQDWIVGSTGVWAGDPQGEWRSHGPYPFAVEGIQRAESSLLVGTGHGLWEAPLDPVGRWTQLHDEALTEVLDVARDAEGAPVAAGSYGVSVSTTDEFGLRRWRSLTEDLSPDQRYTNVIRLAGPDLWLAATEAGVLISTNSGLHWESTELSGSPVRSLEKLDDQWWAGTDDRGLWCSHDGHAWKQVDCPAAAVFSVALSGNNLLVGGYDGVHWRNAQGVWKQSGPRALIRCLVMAGKIWVAGADPGGLWVSGDEGASWHRQGPFQRVTVICPPGGAA